MDVFCHLARLGVCQTWSEKMCGIWKVELLLSFVCHSILYIYMIFWLHITCVMQDIICAKTKRWGMMVDGLNAKRRNLEKKLRWWYITSFLGSNQHSFLPWSVLTTTHLFGRPSRPSRTQHLGEEGWIPQHCQVSSAQTPEKKNEKKLFGQWRDPKFPRMLLIHKSLVQNS